MLNKTENNDKVELMYILFKYEKGVKTYAGAVLRQNIGSGVSVVVGDQAYLAFVPGSDILAEFERA